MCDRKYISGDKSTFGSNMPKKVNKKNICFLLTYLLFVTYILYIYLNIEIQICLGIISASYMRKWFRVWNGKDCPV